MQMGRKKIGVRIDASRRIRCLQADDERDVDYEVFAGVGVESSDDDAGGPMRLWHNAGWKYSTPSWTALPLYCTRGVTFHLYEVLPTECPEFLALDSALTV
jgi:hypothetical protein